MSSFLVNKKLSKTRLWPVEIVIIIYLLITGILILLFHRQLSGEWIHLGVRGGIIIVFFVLAYLNNKHKQNKVFYLLRLLFPLLLLAYLYKETDYLNNLFFPENLDPFFSKIEFALFGMQPSLAFSEKFNTNRFAELMYFGYFSYYLLILFIPLYAYFKKGGVAAERIIFIVINSFLIYYLIFILIPVAGPQFYFTGQANTLPGGYVFGPVMKYIQQNGEGQTGAFPSSHVSICLILLYICLTEFRNIWPFVLIISVLLLFSTVYLKAHYVIDVIGAFLTTPVVYLISSGLYTKFNSHTYDKPSNRFS